MHLNATKAAVNAGYSPKTAFTIGSENLRKPYIQERISYMQNNLAETAQISALSVLKEHQKIAYSSIAHMHQTWIERTDFELLTDDQKACVESISTKIIKANIGTKNEPEISAKIMIEGMTRGISNHGDFTGVSLETYFNSYKDDPINARRIINGLDQANKIAGYHYKFLNAIKKAS